MKLYDEAFVCRSKNAGPFQVTIDLMFSTPESYRKVLGSPNFTAEKIGALYHLPPEKIAIKPFDVPRYTPGWFIHCFPMRGIRA